MKTKTWNGLKLYWGSLHCHVHEMYCHVGEAFSSEKLAALRPEVEALYKFARDERGLDFLAYADHYNMGGMIRMGYRDDSPWKVVSDVTDEWNQDGQFVTLKGYEYNNVMDYNVYLHATEQLPYGESWNGLLRNVKQGAPGVILAAHYRPSPTDWRFQKHKNFRLIEILNDGGTPFEDWANKGLAAGHHAAFIGGSDDHSCKPARVVTTGVWAKSLTREGIWDGLQNRRCIAVARHRPFLTFQLGNSLMGASVECDGIRVFKVSHDCATRPLAVFLIRNGSASGEARPKRASFVATIEDNLAPSGLLEDYYYVKIIYPDGGVAYSSPIWARRQAGRLPKRLSAKKDFRGTARQEYKKLKDIGSRVGWHRFVNAWPIAAACPCLRMGKDARDMVVHSGPDPLLATASGSIIAPCMEGIREFKTSGRSSLLRSFDSKVDQSILVTALAQSATSILAGGYVGEAVFLETLRGAASLSSDYIQPARPFFFVNKLVTPSFLAGDGTFLYVLGERELFMLTPESRILAACQAGYPAFPCAVAAANAAYVYTLSCDGVLTACDLSASQTGRLRWQAQAPGGCVSLLAFDDRVWAYNDRLNTVAMRENIHIWEYDSAGRMARRFTLDLFNLRGAGLARLPNGKLAGIHNPSRKSSAIYRDALNETGRLRLLQKQ